MCKMLEYAIYNVMQNHNTFQLRKQVLLILNRKFLRMWILSVCPYPDVTYLYIQNI